ncbi:DUF6397 family protein [Streptomyces sp. NPDC096323]|uniref:DUF6397 family protein n=1 Tax=Streptomyces sp. NPDC096323 TaxID=3155822 RepID=UPI0033308830
MPTTETVRDDGGHTVSASRAAAELELRRGEFALAVHLGIVQVDAGQADARARVRQEEIGRLRSQDGFPEALRERVRTVGTAEGAELLGISPVRFARLARAGCLTPVAFYLNRYRAVVWLYLAQEVVVLAARSPELLVGHSPPWMRRMLDAGTDCRPRNWRARRTERLLALTDDPWARAAVVAESLDPVQLAEVVDDPYERSYLGRVRPVPVFGRGGSGAGREAMAQLMLADEPDEILWRRVTLGMELDSARELRAAPRPGERAPTETAGPVAPPEPVGSAGSVGATEPVGSIESVGATESVGAACAPAERFEPGAQESGGHGGAGSGGGGAPGLLARLRLRRPRGSRRPPGGSRRQAVNRLSPKP